MDRAASCPLCGDYEGDPRQVEAHISSKIDDVHKGESGHEWRAEIQNQVGEPGDGTPGQADDEADDEADLEAEADSGETDQADGEADLEDDSGETDQADGGDQENGTDGAVGDDQAGSAAGPGVQEAAEQTDPEADDEADLEAEDDGGEEDAVLLLVGLVLLWVLFGDREARARLREGIQLGGRGGSGGGF